MGEIQLRAMSSEDATNLIARMAHDFALDQVAAGNWDAADAQRLAREEMARLLPQAERTDGMALLSAFDEDRFVGHVWLCLAPRIAQTGEAWLYDIEVEESARGRGYGRALLAAAEAEAARAGATFLGLNVFGVNRVAHSLYETSGYEVKATQMRKRLGD